MDSRLTGCLLRPGSGSAPKRPAVSDLTSLVPCPAVQSPASGLIERLAAVVFVQRPHDRLLVTVGREVRNGRRHQGSAYSLAPVGWLHSDRVKFTQVGLDGVATGTDSREPHDTPIDLGHPPTV